MRTKAGKFRQDSYDQNDKFAINKIQKYLLKNNFIIEEKNQEDFDIDIIALEAEGYYVIKLIKTNKNGIPDLVAIPPNCGVIFSEVKKPKGRVSALQEFRLKELEKHGVRTEVYRG